MHVSNSTFWYHYFHFQVCLDPSTSKVHNKRNFNLGLVFANFFFAKRRDTPWKVEKKLSWGTISIVIHSSSKSTGGNVFRRRKNRILPCAAVLQTQVPKLCTDLGLSHLYIFILETWSKFARKNNFPALGICFPQSCSSAGRRFAASLSTLGTCLPIEDMLCCYVFANRNTIHSRGFGVVASWHCRCRYSQIKNHRRMWREDTTVPGVSLQQADTTYPDKISCCWLIAHLWVELLSFTALI